MYAFSVTKLCKTLCDPMDCRLPGSSIHGILQARILEWVAMPFCRRSSCPRYQTLVSCITGGFFTTEPPRKPLKLPYDPAILLVATFPKITIIQKDIHTPVFTAALFTIARTWKQPGCPLTGEWTKQMWYIYIQ